MMSAHPYRPPGADPAAIAGCRQQFLLLWAALGLVKLGLAATVPLFGDEAFYWLEAQRPAWAYSDVPAATAWMAWLGTAVGGDSTLGLRWPFLVLGSAMPWLVWRIARRWFGEAAGWQAATLSMLLPLLGTMGVLALPDVALTFATLVCLDAGAMLLQRATPRAFAWLATGLAIGALAHYRFPMVILAGAAALLSVPEGRRLLARPGLWLALAVGALAWLPLLAWNLMHGQAGIGFQLVDRHPWSPHAAGLLLPIAQVVIVTPVLLVLLGCALVHAIRRWRAGDRIPWAYVAVTAAVPLAAFVVLGVFADRERVSFHWMLPGYLPLLAVAPLLLRAWPRAWRAALFASAGLGLAAALGYLLIAASPALRERAIGGMLPYPANFAGWPEVGREVQARLATRPPETRVVADNFMLAAQIGFALGRDDIGVLDHPLNHKHGRAAQLALWDLVTEPRDPYRPTLLVLDDEATRPREWLRWYREVCLAAAGLPTVEVLVVDGGRKRFLVFELAAGRPPTPAERDCVVPALSALEAIDDGRRIGRDHVLRGWAFKDGAGVERVEVLVDGSPVADARHGLPAAHVGTFWAVSLDPDHPDVGFEAPLCIPVEQAGWRWLGVRVHGRDGSIEVQRQYRVQVDAGSAGGNDCADPGHSARVAGNPRARDDRRAGPAAATEERP